MLDSDQFAELKASGKLPSPAGAALKVIELCQRNNVTLSEVIAALRIDPAMVGRLLKLANSAAFSRPRPAVALTPDVLMSIGLQTVRQLVLAFSLVSGYRTGRCPGFDYEVFWSRSAATGVATQVLSTAVRAAPSAEMFTVGLLSHVGRLALAALHPVRYGELLAQVSGQFAPALMVLEQQAFGYTHPEVASAMMRDWGLPKLFTDAVLLHETLKLPDFGKQSRSARLVNCLHLGARMAELCFMPQAERATEFQKLLPFAQELGIADANLGALGDQMLHEWKDWGALLTLSVPEVTPFSALNTVTEDAAEPVDGRLEQLSILVVDDDPSVCLLLQKFLSAAGHTVHLAHDGHEGLAQALQHQPQLIITDLLMPHQDGLQLIKSLRSTVLGSSIYIIVLSILDDDAKLTEAFDLGADDYLIKPVQGKLLHARLKVGMRIIHEQEKLRREQEELRRCLLELSITKHLNAGQA